MLSDILLPDQEHEVPHAPGVHKAVTPNSIAVPSGFVILLSVASEFVSLFVQQCLSNLIAIEIVQLVSCSL